MFVGVNKTIGSNDALELEKGRLQIAISEIRKKIDAKQQEIERFKVEFKDMILTEGIDLNDKN